jgi:hypothetical protein
MKYIKSDDKEHFDTEERNLDEGPITVANASGYGGCDVEITAGIMTWQQLDKLKEAIKEAELRWRGKATILPPFHHS